MEIKNVEYDIKFLIEDMRHPASKIFSMDLRDHLEIFLWDAFLSNDIICPTEDIRNNINLRIK